MDPLEKQIRQRLKDNFIHYAMRCLKIRTKSGVVESFILNKAQTYTHDLVEEQKNTTGKVRAIILKGRQQGCSTYIEGRFYWKVTHHPGMRAFILTHEENATNNLFEMAKRYHDNCPVLVKPTTQASNAKELIFAGMDSGYKLGTAGNKSVGRSSTIQFLHGSEAAFWQHADEHAKGIMQAVSDSPNTEIFIESTANGVGNYFHQQWQLAEAGISEFIPIFIPWYWQNEYVKKVPEDFRLDSEEEELKRLYGLTDSQLVWRRSKIIDLSISGTDGLKSFKQEYPCNANEAFQMTGEDTFIDSHLIMRARKSKAEKYGPLLIGVDGARFGDDRTSIVRRQGRVIFGVESYIKKDTMEVTGIVHNIIVNENPLFVFIDIGGLGAGIYDRLLELGHKKKIVAVNFGSKALNEKKYANKRAEMWGLFKEWLLQEPVKLPDIDSLHADLCGTKYKFDSNGRLLMERKEDMKKRGIRSPDEADAAILTFAYPQTALVQDECQKKEVAKQVMSQMNKHIEIQRNRSW
jgi:hypothetical protein